MIVKLRTAARANNETAFTNNPFLFRISWKTRIIIYYTELLWQIEFANNTIKTIKKILTKSIMYAFLLDR